jgi:hypothetical protein
MKPTTKPSAGIPGYVSLAGLAFLGYVAFAMGNKPKDNTVTEDYTEPDPTTPNATPLNNNLVLKLGSKGAEVKKLQSLMGITADGIFGIITQGILMKLKGVNQTSIKQFLSTPTINQNILDVGTNVMAKLKSGTPIYEAIAKVDTSYYSTHKIVKTIPYGRKVGKIRSSNPAGNWYAVYFDTFFGTEVGFVKATDIEKY